MRLTTTADRVLRIVAAALVAAGGIVHLKLWSDGYRDIDKIGPSFLLNGLASLAVAVALVVWRHWIPVLAALAVVDATLLAFGLSRTSRGIFDFVELGWNPSPEAAIALVVELAAVVALCVLLVMGREDDLSRST
jgi:hypothetical protein